MAITVTGKVTASIPVSGTVTLTFTDTTTGVGTLVSRVLNIYDCNGVLLDTINMGAILTANYYITADMYLMFIETIVDNTGTYNGEVNFVSTSFYMSVYAPAVAAVQNYCCDTFGKVSNLSNAQNNRYAAVDMAVFGQGVVAQNLITEANFLVNTPYYA